MTTLAPTTILEPQLGDAVDTTTVRRESATTATPATSSGSSCGPSSRSPCCCSSTSPSRRATGSGPTSARRRPTFRTRLGSSCSASCSSAVSLAPAAVLAVLAFQGRWRGRDRRRSGRRRSRDVRRRRLLLDPAPAIRGAIDADAWWIATTFPTPLYTAAVFAAVTVAKPWLSRTWRPRRRRIDRRARGGRRHRRQRRSARARARGRDRRPRRRLVLVAFGAPNRRPSPAAIAAALGAAGIDVTQLDLRRAVGGRSQLYRATTPEGGLFLKVYSDDSRDADLLYRSYRTLVLRDSDDGWPPPALARDVEHEAFLMMLASRHGVACPALRAVAAAARRFDGAGDAGPRRPAARRARGRRSRRRTCSTTCGVRFTRCTGPVWRTDRCGRPTCS